MGVGVGFVAGGSFIAIGIRFCCPRFQCMLQLRRFEWMKYLHGILHGTKWVPLHGLLNISLDPFKKT